jgi:DnaJ-class molecular chaperone
MEMDPCRICGGDGRVSNAFGGSSTTCPGCHGSGRRREEPLFRDVTKTKPSHHTQKNKSVATAKSSEPTTAIGMQLRSEILGSTLPDDLKSKLISEIVEYEGSHGRCTDTFTKKVRKQLRGN